MPNLCELFQLLWTKYWIFSVILLVPRDSGNFRLNTEICTYATEAWGGYLSNIDTVNILAYEAGLSLTWSETPKTGFLLTWFIIFRRFPCSSCSFHEMGRLMTKPKKWLCAQRRLRSAQSLCCPHEESLSSYCPGWSQSSLGAHSFCWFFMSQLILWYEIRVNFPLKEELKPKFLLSCFVKLDPGI